MDQDIIPAKLWQKYTSCLLSYSSQWLDYNR